MKPEMSATGRGGRPPSIRSRLATSLLVWALLWGAAVGLAVWHSATQEVDELLDDTLVSSAALLSQLLELPGSAGAVPASRGADGGHFAWQVTSADGVLLLRSSRAPGSAWHPRPVAGFRDLEDWRVYGLAMGGDGRMLYAAQTRDERIEARTEVAMGAALAALAVGLLGYVWLRFRVRAELRPLERLSERLAQWDAERPDAQNALGPAERRELEPVHRAVEELTQRLQSRIASERAFAAHAAHALRTPLAGIDAQLAVAQRECPDELRERLGRVRGAAARLQSVVGALLGLFRAAGASQPEDVDLADLMARLPAAGLKVDVAPGARVVADPDLLAAALANLVDNAQRHGARRVRIEAPDPHRLRLADDGPGVDEAHRLRLQAALDAQGYEDAVGLGLTLADRVARSHGGRVELLPSGHGFVVEMALGPAAPEGFAAGEPERPA
ncbi:sensor histidine kinase [Quisquiliibacterium transsilvanicum]|uniref:histidine kinase n=1 Tax=Quisquiliibacterium transsilvanicum TaxID=1549638 RepID=A0A7W8HLF3_9BURK|nr:ATP-binding protein [Quisquiliibacterium transsilvanicum]MBB5273270.1 signal transduction histidine kinase [Quisquiliibacterium transsilvanicum]